ncbi:MAG: hypothetical protein EBQ96_05380 [Proteobacteria bacterium]|nr:hypothetical protein [Pseudomonadota bacterium]
MVTTFNPSIPAPSASVSTLQNATRLAVANNNARQQPVTLISRFSTTSITGQVTTVATYSDGSSQTVISEGDKVVLATKTGTFA